MGQPLKSIFLFAAAAAAAASGAPGAAGDPVVELPTYVVTGTRIPPPPEFWRYAAAPGFEFLSDLSESETRERIADFIRFHRAVDVVWPLIRINAQAPATVIFCAGTDRFAQFAPPGTARASLGETISLSMQNHEQAAIIVNLDAARAGAAEGAPADAYIQGLLRTEYVHFLFSRIEPAPPRWLAEGFTELFLEMDYSGSQIGFAPSSDPADFPARKALAARIKAAPGRPLSSWVADPDFQVGVRHGGVLPFKDFFSGAEAGNADLGGPASAWDRQCLEFVHLCLFGEGGRYRKGLALLALAAMHQPVTESLFQQCFQLSYADLQAALWAYTDFSRDVGLKFPPPAAGPGGDPDRISVRTATDAEVGRIKGDALRLAGRLEEAHLNLIAPYLRGARDPQLLAALGQEEAAAGKDERARRFLEAAVAAKTTRARAYLELARLRYAAARQAPAGPGGHLGAAQWSQVLDLLLAARTLKPPLQGTYDLMAEGWEQAPSPPTLDQLSIVVEGVRSFPEDLDLVYRSSRLCVAGGFAESAVTLAQFGLDRSTDPANRERFAKLRASLPVPPK
jgi:hypothetical protein